MSSFKKYKLGDVTSHKKGFAFKSKDYTVSGVPIVRVSDLTENSVDLSSCLYLKKELFEEYKDYTLAGGDMVITTVGSWQYNPASVVGKVIAVPESAANCVLNQNAVRLRAKPGFNQQFIYYNLKTESFNEYIVTGAQGSANQASITLEQIFGFDISIPSLPTQTRIASILSALDDKIELNRQMNQTLEQMAQALFKKYFVDENCDKRELGLLDFADLLTGGTPKTAIKEYWDGDIYWLSAKDVTPNSGGFIIETERKITHRGLSESHAKLLPAYSTVITARGTVGNYCLLSSPMAISQSNYALKAKRGNADFVLFRIVVNLIDEFKRNSYGTVFDTITTQTLKDIKILFPNDGIIAELENQLRPIYYKILQAEFENQSLSKLRDTLLPKLMNGEIEVKAELENEVFS